MISSSSSSLPNEVVVVDNDAAGSARAVVERRRELGAPFPIHYDIQPVKNISLTRNRTVEIANGDWIAFIDDDERAPAAWLRQLAETVIRCYAPTARSVRSSRSCPPMRRHGSGTAASTIGRGCKPAPSSRSTSCASATCCCMARSCATPRRLSTPSYGLTGGEDGDLLAAWCSVARASSGATKPSFTSRSKPPGCRCAGCCCGHCAEGRTLRVTRLTGRFGAFDVGRPRALLPARTPAVGDGGGTGASILATRPASRRVLAAQGIGQSRKDVDLPGLALSRIRTQGHVTTVADLILFALALPATAVSPCIYCS